MSVVLKLPGNGNTKKIYLIYDFKQVSDSILLIMYADELKRWKKFFINYENDIWQTDILASYMDEATLEELRNKLKFIFSEWEHASEPEGLNLEQTMQQDAAFMLGVCS